MQNNFVPVLLGFPSPANHSAPRRRIVGTTAMDSTLLTVVGHPYNPTFAGNGGFKRVAPFSLPNFQATPFLLHIYMLLHHDGHIYPYPNHSYYFFQLV